MIAGQLLMELAGYPTINLYLPAPGT